MVIISQSHGWTIEVDPAKIEMVMGNAKIYEVSNRP